MISNGKIYGLLIAAIFIGATLAVACDRLVGG